MSACSSPTSPSRQPQRSGNVTSFQSTLTYAATYETYLGGLAGITSIPLSATSAVSTPVVAPYLNVEVLLDNSGSMEIAAETSDIATLQELTACAVTGAFYCTAGSGMCSNWVQSDGLPTNSVYYTPSSSGQDYSAYGCSGGSYSYNGPLTCPIPSTTLDGANYPAFPATGNTQGPSCASLLPRYSYNGIAPAAGSPCAFACHFDTGSTAGAGKDFYAVARGTIGSSNPVTLRFDLVKAAVRQLITTMQADNLAINNLNVGVFWFADILTQVYPSTGEAGGGWVDALATVGGPPTVANGPDTGIQPYVGANGGNTDFPTIMNDLAGMLTPSGNGVNASVPRKVLFIVTDGLQDPATRAISAFDPSACTTFKTMGYAIYVLYTPYYSLMNTWYMDGTNPSVAAIVQADPTDHTSIPYNLQLCASAPSNYIEANDSASIAAALQTFLKLAMAPPARLTE